jgi:hypothetical protein
MRDDVNIRGSAPFAGLRGGAARRVVAVALLLLAGLGLSGCSISLSDLPMGDSGDGARKETDAFPAVNDLPRDRADTAMAPDERSRIERELIDARDRQASVATAKPAAPAK